MFLFCKVQVNRLSLTINLFRVSWHMKWRSSHGRIIHIMGPDIYMPTALCLCFMWLMYVQIIASARTQIADSRRCYHYYKFTFYPTISHGRMNHMYISGHNAFIHVLWMCARILCHPQNSHCFAYRHTFWKNIVENRANSGFIWFRSLSQDSHMAQRGLIPSTFGTFITQKRKKEEKKTQSKRLLIQGHLWNSQ